MSSLLLIAVAVELVVAHAGTLAVALDVARAAALAGACVVAIDAAIAVAGASAARGIALLGVLLPRIHHHGSRGIPVPPYLRRLGQWMAVMTFSKYPPVERQLSNLTNGDFGSV